MADPFFSGSFGGGGGGSKRKRDTPTLARAGKGKAPVHSKHAAASGDSLAVEKKRRKAKDKDEVLSEDSDGGAAQPSGDESSEDDGETAQEKRLRLAKAFIAKLEDEEREKGADNIDADAIAHRLRDDLNEQRGVLHRKVAISYPSKLLDSALRVFRHRGLPVTTMQLSLTGRHVYCGCKGGSVTKWSVATGERLFEIEGLRKVKNKLREGAADDAKPRAPSQAHTGDVLSLALSTDDKFLASGGADKQVIIWDAAQGGWLKTFPGHRAMVTALSFRRQSHQLFSGSGDRTVKVWDLDIMSYVETLYGHQDTVVALDSLDRERALSCGARDRSLRLWKIVEETQLAFEGNQMLGSIDCMTMITESAFVSGSQDGTLNVWDVLKKKPTATQAFAHGKGNGITTVAAVRYGDAVASGSIDGFVRLWKTDGHHRNIVPLLAIPLVGHINSLGFLPSGGVLAVGVAQEPRLGRYDRIQAARNGVVIVTLTAPKDKGKKSVPV